MKTVRERMFWALGAARLWRLNDGEARMLAAIASHANDQDECTASNKRLAFLTDRHPETARKLIRQLRRRGVIDSEIRHGTTHVRRLRTDLHPVEQLELDLAAMEAAEDNAGAPPVSAAPTPCHPAPDDTGSPATPRVTAAPGGPVSAVTPQKESEGLKSGENAREHTPSDLPRLAEVLAILGDAKPDEVLINDRAILSALEAHPESAGFEHVKAAHRVVAWTHDPCGGPSIASAPRLLWSVLDKQAEDRVRAEQAAAAGGPGRFARPEPEPEKPWWDGALARSLGNEQAQTSEAASA